MTDIQLYHQLSLLPDKLKQEVENFIEFLKHKEKQQKLIKKRQFGCAKGKIKMLEGFDEPYLTIIATLLIESSLLKA